MDNTNELRRLLADLCELTVWMSGSADFGPAGQAHAGWVKGRPALNRVLAYLTEAERAEKPNDWPTHCIHGSSVSGVCPECQAANMALPENMARAEKLRARSEAARKAARSRKAMKDARDEADARRSSGGSR